jgi:hypothetical protein
LLAACSWRLLLPMLLLLLLLLLVPLLLLLALGWLFSDLLQADGSYQASGHACVTASTDHSTTQ